MIRVEKLQQETGCTREHAMQAVAATGLQVARRETKQETVLRRAVALMRWRGVCWSKAIDLAAETVE
jgi:hypothetical protein